MCLDYYIISVIGCDSKKEDTRGVSELFDAIFAQDTEAVKALCQGGVDVNGKSQEDGLRPLDRAAGRDGGQEIVMVLIMDGAKVNVTDERGWTPLHFAAMKGRVENAKILIKNSAEVNAKDRLGKTPLHWAVSRGGKEMVAYLRSQDGTL